MLPHNSFSKREATLTPSHLLLLLLAPPLTQLQSLCTRALVGGACGSCATCTRLLPPHSDSLYHWLGSASRQCEGAENLAVASRGGDSWLGSCIVARASQASANELGRVPSSRRHQQSVCIVRAVPAYAASRADAHPCFPPFTACQCVRVSE